MQNDWLFVLLLFTHQALGHTVYRHIANNGTVTFSYVPASGMHTEPIRVAPVNRINAFEHLPTPNSGTLLLPEQEPATDQP